MNNKKKELIILGIVTLVLIVTLGVTYAIFTFSKTSVKSELIAGDIYMKYKETKGISLSNAMPRETYDPNGYFEFTIEGKNTYTEKDIYYDVVLDHGDEPSDANRTIRIEDKYLHFRLVEVVNNEEQEIFQDEKYNNIQNKRIYVNTIPKNTTNNISHVYRLYMWIGNEVGIGNTSSATYSTSDWNHVYASIKVNVTGDFTEKEVNPSTPAVCFTTSDNGDNTETVTGLVKDSYTAKSSLTTEEIQTCANFVSSDDYFWAWGSEESAEEFCSGTGTYDGESFQYFLETCNDNSVLSYLYENNIVNYVPAPNNCKISDIIIPKVINGKSVTVIGENAFDGSRLSQKLTSVEIPNSVTTIGNFAFHGNQLTSVEIPNSVTTIGNFAFQGNQLTSVEIPNSVTTIGNFAFQGNQLTSVEIPNSATTIGDGAFQVNKLTSVEIPNSVTTIGSTAFSDNQLTSVTIGNGITSIGSSAFSKGSFSNPNLNSIKIDKSCNDIKNSLNLNNYNHTNYYPWLSINSPYTASGLTVYGSGNEVCDTFN